MRDNIAQFSLLVLINGFVGAMVGMERSILPAIAEHEFGLAARSAVLSFIVVFGVVKALTNYFAGRLSDRVGRKRVLVAGWFLAIPVPFLLMWAPSWNWILVANVFLGASQGLTWSTTVIMKIDLVGSRQRGLAMGLNEFAGYCAVAVASLVTGYVAATYGLRPQPFYFGVVVVIAGTVMSMLFVRDTLAHAHLEAWQSAAPASGNALTPGAVFMRTTFLDRNLSAVTQAGLVNNLNDGIAWGLFPVLYAVNGLSLATIGWLTAIYPATWGVFQLITGALSDRWGRKWLIASGMCLQGCAIALVVPARSAGAYALCAVLLGIGTAMVYPTLLAAIGDRAHPSWRATAVGVYRLWRDMGYAIGALLAGVMADLFGIDFAITVVAILTIASGFIVMLRMREPA